MAWKDLLAASMRLVDLYDANRELGPGGVAPVAPSRARKIDDTDAGVLFDLGTAILEILEAKEEETSGTYVLVEEIMASLKPDFPKCGQEDFLFVLHKMSLRYPLFFSREQVLLKDTALIERAPAGQRIRLSSKGRIALSLSEAAEDWLYSDLDAEKILRAIARGDFAQVLKYTLALSQTVKEASIKVIRMLELPSSELREQALYTDNKLYSETVSRIQAIVLEAAHAMKSPEITAKVDMWAAAHPEEIDVDQIIEERLALILSSIESLSRNLSEVINSAVQGGLPGVRAMPFQEAARRFAMQDQTVVAEQALFNAGFWRPPLSFGSAFDVLTPVVGRAKPDRTEFSFDQNGALIKEFIRAFVELHGEDFIRRIKATPLALSEVLERGLFGATSLRGLGEAVGVFVDAQALGFHSGCFVVRFGEGQYTREDMDMSIRADELILEYLEDADVS